jgi:transmembrane sensor
MKHDNAPVSAAILDQAIEWQLTLGSGKATRKDKQALTEWLGIHPDHARAWRQLGELDRKLAPARGQSVRTLLTQPRKSALRQTTTLATIALLLCASLFSLHQYKPLTMLLADYTTATGQRRQITLPDQSIVHLNTRSAIDVAFDANSRIIQLREGEIAVQTAHNNPHELRPFFVQTDDGSFRALGTRFIVKKLPQGGTLLTVTQSAVMARPAQCQPMPDTLCTTQVQVETGESLLVNANRTGTISKADSHAGAWQDGMLAVDNMRLADVIEELQRYRVGYIAVDRDIADLRVTGTFALTDTDYALRTLIAVLPVNMHTITPLWISLEPVSKAR